MRDRGFGFLASEVDNQEYFFHASALTNSSFETLEEGDPAIWDGLNTIKGNRATNIVMGRER